MGRSVLVLTARMARDVLKEIPLKVVGQRPRGRICCINIQDQEMSLACDLWPSELVVYWGIMPETASCLFGDHGFACGLLTNDCIVISLAYFLYGFDS